MQITALPHTFAEAFAYLAVDLFDPGLSTPLRSLYALCLHLVNLKKETGSNPFTGLYSLENRSVIFACRLLFGLFDS